LDNPASILMSDVKNFVSAQSKEAPWMGWDGIGGEFEEGRHACA